MFKISWRGNTVKALARLLLQCIYVLNIRFTGFKNDKCLFFVKIPDYTISEAY